MKKNLKLFGLLALALTITFASCRREDDPTPEEQALNSLEGTWNFTTADAGSDADVDISGASITFGTDRNYTISSLTVLNDNNLNVNATLQASGSFTIDAEANTLTIGSETIGYNVNRNNGDLTLTYTSPYPKETSADANISLNASLQQ